MLLGVNPTRVLVGVTTGWLGQSIYLREIEGREACAPPPVNLETEKANGNLVRALIENGMVSACHDLSDGGLAIAVAEMALASEGLGAHLNEQTDLPSYAYLFGEDQARYLVATSYSDAVLTRAKTAGVSARIVGHATNDGRLTLTNDDSIPLCVIRSAHEDWLPKYMQGS